MLAADYIVDIGPGAGVNGGQVVACGTPAEVMANPNSLTGQYLSGARKVPLPAAHRKPSGWLTVKGARANNLKNIDASFPLGVLCCVTGVSGSGKSSLVNEILYKSLSRTLNRSRQRAADHDEIRGVDQLDKVIQIPMVQAVNYDMFSTRLSLPVTTYIPGFGWGTMYGDIVE